MKYNPILIFLSSFTDIFPCTVYIISINILWLLNEIWSFILKKVKLDIELQTILETIILIVAENVSPFATFFFKSKNTWE